MSFEYKTACVFGGTGFLGRYVVQALARKGVTVKVATRTPQSAYFLRTYGVVGQIVPVFCDTSEDSIRKAVQGCDYVVNCVGILYESGKSTFDKIHRALPETIAKACAAEKVARLTQISALGIEESKSRYAKSKLAGEEAVKAAYPAASILRPSLIFGPEDNFFNKFARLAGVLPFLPLIGGGKTKFQPVYVADIADAVMETLTGPEELTGKTYALGGPEVVTFKDMMELMLKETERKAALISVPFFMAKIKAFFLKLVPGAPLLTIDQVRSLQSDNVVRDGQAGFAELGIVPTAMELIVARYLSAYRNGGRFSFKNKVA
ncbi:MAG: complex I NDUFA9 subunit family protein [Pseudobdellovibrionaceae bacterium]